ncbi:MAG TPA: methylated-DNA--[protein]-cysteine S-methyltransferase [Caldisericia bacterium]|nr:methylated-DNA--[protein]-cysteine S-methyltransferase [Caldisericia bacterium]
MLKLPNPVCDKLKFYHADNFVHPLFLRFIFTPSFLASLHLSFNEELVTCSTSALPVEQRDYPPWLNSFISELKAYLNGETVSFSTPYQFLPNKMKWQKAWEALQEIPYGQTVSYKNYSQRIGLKNPRNAGWVLSQNPFPLIFPCHRVIRSDGSLGGFTPDPNIKKWLLDMEQAANV